jgi:hypothetical protein
MRTVLTDAYTERPGAVLVHGDAPKGDRHAAYLWRQLGGEVEPWPAKWAECSWDCPHATHRKVNRAGQEYCPGAGMRRNAAMVESAPDLVLVFVDPKSKTQGASHCAGLAIDAGIPTLVYRQGVAGVEMHNVDKGSVP